ncbi:pyridoxamine 5'-phosphate oxidase family protein [Microbacterium paludicola]|uniref:PPOX class F420-dependent oxidoreductase n=1 Tax=Microbacterium paludicola TaxID=300019 RepID=A0A4Y9FX85_9MICO|nr:PPOX class F420-dependent oxidoreductase [Microbacterium paludicola]MBF0815424.1 PPOX class F420-dependent oxidoreductase [Microbacterium paludicola]TFU33963.1 PPOX class F420-dependent oxidoreductase [Microbacterium paludicola]
MTSWVPEWDGFPASLLEFWTERHLCTLTTLRADGRPHVTPVGVALDLEYRCAWVITSRSSLKAKLVGRDPRVAACQVDGRHWSTLEGTASVLDDPESVRRAEERYAARYRTPRPNPERVAIRVEIDRFLVSQSLTADLPSS